LASLTVLDATWTAAMVRCISECNEMPRPATLEMQDTVPAESSIISKLLEANNKATDTNFTHMYVERNAAHNVCVFPHEMGCVYWPQS